MCGFSALYSPDQTAPTYSPSLLRATRIIAHRGPDDEAFYVSPQFSAGFRRLKIIDLTDNARQPMSDATGRYWIIFNGEIYNYRDLRRDLESSGVAFRTASDTEVLLQAYIQWGQECLTRLNGMFAFLIWDEQEKVLFGARDRFGEKPLYYMQDGSRWLFASEIKSIIALLGRVPAVHPLIVKHYLVERWTDFSTQTFFKEIFTVPAAHYFVLRHGNFQVSRYWDLSEARVDVDADPIPRFRELLLDSIRLRMNADVSVGTCLSGGLDSGTIVSAIPRVLNGNSSVYSGKTFTAAYPEYDERLPIQDVNSLSGSVGYFETPVPDSLDDLGDLLWKHDEPFHSFMTFASHRIMRRARQEGVTVLLNGQGADETLAGYAKYFPFYLRDLLCSFQYLEAWKSVNNSSELTRTSGLRSAATALVGLFREQAGHALRSAGLLSSRKAQSSDPAWILDREFRRRFDHGNSTPLPVNPNSFTTRRIGPLKSKLLYSIFFHNLPLYLRVEDRNSMANSIESRLPFLDHRLVEYAFSVSTFWFMRNGQNKFLLRRAAENLLPASALNRRTKFGFPVPEVDWLYGAFRNQVVDILNSQELKQRGFLDVGALSSRFVKEADSWPQSARSLGEKRSLWFRIICLEYWFRGMARYQEMLADESLISDSGRSVIVNAIEASCS